MNTEAQPAASRGRGRGRGRTGKALRARGKRGVGRAANFGQRLFLDGEGPADEEDEEAASELAARFSRRELATNAHRYEEEVREVEGDGEEEEEPEVDLTSFLERQRNEDSTTLQPQDSDGIDHSLDTFLGNEPQRMQRNEPRIQTVEWTKEMSDLAEEKKQADAARDLASRFRTHTTRVLSMETTPAKQSADVSIADTRGQERGNEDFLDDLLS